MPKQALSDLIAAAGALLGGDKRPVPLELVERISDDDRRNTLLRLRVTGGPDAGRTVVAKQVVGFAKKANDWTKGRFYGDALGALFLTQVSGDRHAPRCLGVDVGLGFILMDDLGAVESLVEPLLEGSADRAREALLTYVRRLGAMHADTAGRQREYDEIADSMQAPPRFRTRQSRRDDDRSLRQGLEGLSRQLAELKLGRIGPAIIDEVEQVAGTVRDPGDFAVLLHRDACPDNMAFGSDRLRLIDFEFTRFGHALIDGLYPQLPFPTCWCCNVVPDGLADELTAAYRAELVHGCPSAADDAVFARASAHITAWWLLCSFGWPFENTVKEDDTWGLASNRARELTRLARFAEVADRTGELPAMAELARSVEVNLRRRWPNTEPLPIYPALR
jgi:Phosphotransferase enzyme family